MTDLQNLAVNATDSTCWVIDGNQLVHLDSGGEELWRGGDFPGGGGWDKGLAVDSGDGSVWVTEPELSSRITHLRADGIELGRVELDSLCVAVSVDPGDHSCWIADRGFIFGRSYYGGRVYHVSAEGTVLSTTDFRCGSVAVNLEDHSCWAADIGQLQVVHLAPDGTELGRGGTFRYDAAVSVDPQDGSCWLADTSNGQVSHLGVVPEAGFTTNVLSGEVSFIDTSTGYPKAWAWDFGDGTTSAAQSPTHQYWASGTYVVSLTASNAYGFDTSVREIPIAVALEELSGWPRDGGSGSPALGDLEGDGDPEVVGSLDGVHAWHADGTLVTGWPQMVGSNMTDPALADLDRDGALEVIAGSYAGQVHVWHADGTSAAGWPQAVGAPVTSAQAAGDIDGDGWPEIVAAGQDGRVYVWSWDGSPVAGWPQEAGGTLTTYPALGDLDSDGRLEVVAGAGNGSVYAWHGDGTALAGWPRTTGDAIDGFPALGDMDGDGALDVVTGSWDGNVYAWHADGSLVAGWPQLTGPSDYSGEPAVVGSVALGDLDADGGLEVVVGAADGKVYAWHASGVLESGWPQATLGFGFGSPSLADLDGDGLLEVIIGVAHSGMSGWITAWHADGTPVVGFDINGGYYVLDSPALADLDMDGRVEMAIGLLGSTTHVWKLPTTTTDLMPWPMFHHDAQRTGLYEPTALPQAEFSATPTSGPASLTVHFSDRSSGRPISWAWDFGDGAVSVAQSPAHVYTTAGTFTVSLTVANALGTDTETKASLISVAPALHADFTATPTNGSAPLAVQFTDLSTGTPTSWNWDFGDGATSAAQHPAHTYSTPGRRTVNLTVTNAYGSSVEAKSRYVVVSFPDVDTAHWAIDEILACVDAGIVFGYPDGKYYPDLAVTRDQMAVYVSRALVSPSGDAAIPDGPATPSFSDVPSGHWAYRHIEYAVSQNVVKGYEDGTYLPGVAVDRGQMAAYVARAMVAPGGDAGIPDGPAAPSFSDVPTTFWAYKQVEYCVGQGVVRGYEDGLYHPEIVVTRDQMAVYVARTFELPL
ncbi:MAG: PKD domain-containing protein [Armatimonadota bacterium]